MSEQCRKSRNLAKGLSPMNRSDQGGSENGLCQMRLKGQVR